MTILVTGASGLMGSALVTALKALGHYPVALQRKGPQLAVDRPTWDPRTGAVESGSADRWDAVVHLAGENIAGRWTAGKKERIRSSRVEPTRKLCEFLAGSPAPPTVLVCASAIGYYGSRGDEWLTEDSAPGTGFLPEVCCDWEAATEPAQRAGIRVVNTRFGIVLSPDGGALAAILPVFRMGLGGRVGHGRQFWSWISLRDAVAGLMHALGTQTLSGPVNLVSPNPLRNSEFTQELGRALRRPTVLPVPASAARLILGEMAESLLLASIRAEPARLRETSFKFQDETLESALRSAGVR